MVINDQLLKSKQEKDLHHLKNEGLLRLDELLAIWRTHSMDRNDGSLIIIQQVCDQIIKVGEPLIALDILNSVLEEWPDDIRLLQLFALASARTGAPERAHEGLKKLGGAQSDDAETLGLQARIYKDLWKNDKNGTLGKINLQLASETYEKAYRLHNLPWPGINAATTALLLGNASRAQVLAKDVTALCLQLLEHSNDKYWIHCTSGEAAIILEEWDNAATEYAHANQLGKGRFADLSTTKQQALLLLKHLGKNKDWLYIPKIPIRSIISTESL